VSKLVLNLFPFKVFLSIL